MNILRFIHSITIQVLYTPLGMVVCSILCALRNRLFYCRNFFTDALCLLLILDRSCKISIDYTYAISVFDNQLDWHQCDIAGKKSHF
jgi:hypothetical protein